MTWAVLAAFLIAGASSLLGQTQNDKDLSKRRAELLTGYAAFKKYSSQDPAVVYKGLTPDRQAVYDSIIRALFVSIQDRDGNPGKRVIDFVDDVRGIWGVRLMQKEGRFMFRLSMRFAPGLEDALRASLNLPKSVNGHVLLPVEGKGGDDDPSFTGFDKLLTTSGVVTFREAAKEPKLQVSLIDDQPTIGEVDIDFDSMTLFCGCHCTPSNSDVGSRKRPPDTHVHLSAFNIDVPFFSKPLELTWSSTAHCKDTY